MLTIQTNPKPLINYDEEYDVVTVHFKGKAIPSYCQDVEEWLQVFRALDSREHVGVSVWDFWNRYRSGELKKVNLPFSIDWDAIASSIKH